MANDVEITVKVNNRAGAGFTSINSSLAKLKKRAEEATTALTAMHTAATDVDVKATLDDQVTSGIAAISAALDGVRGQTAEVAVKLDDQTASGIAAVTAALDGLRAQTVEVAVKLDDQTGPGIADVTTALADLKAHSPVKLEVTFDGQTAEITAAAQAMQDLKSDTQGARRALTTLGTKATTAATALETLKDKAQAASRSLLGLAANATTAATALGELRDKASSAARALGRLDTRADGAGTRLNTLAGHSRTLRGDMDDLDGVVRRLAGNLGGLRGRIGTISTSAGQASGGMSMLARAALLLGPALLPIAAAAVPVAGNIAAATAAVAAFGVAIIPQVKRVSEAVQAHTKYSDAVRESGRSSKEAVKAEDEMAAAFARLNPASKQTAGAFLVLKDRFKKWSDDLSKFTMEPVTRSLQLTTALLPKLTPLAKGASEQLSRLVTIAGGAVATPGFDRMMDKFSDFSTRMLSRAVDGLIHFSRTTDGFSGGVFQEFLAYARDVGPQVGETLRNLGSATANLLGSMGDLGVTSLELVNALARLVNALPSEFVGTVLEAYFAFKLFGLAASGVLALGGALRKAGQALVAFRAAAVAAGGGLAGLRAAFLGLSAAAKTTVVVAGLTALVLALSKLSSIGKQAPPEVDKLTSALAKLGHSGKATGELSRVFGKDLGELYNKVRSLTDPSTADKIQQFLVSWTGFDSTPVKDAKEHLNAIDEALANLVKDGKADLAAAAVERLKKAYSGQDKHAVKEFTRHLDDYKSAIADAKFEQELVAQSMGLFGQQALATSEKLAEQKRSADGLRQSLQALNDVQRAGLGGMIGFEAAIDAAAEAAKKNAGSLRMVDGELDLNSEKARNAATALIDLAAKADEAAAANRESTGSWEGSIRIYQRARDELIGTAQKMGLTKEQAKQLASQLLQIPDKKLRVEMEREDAVQGLEEVKRKIEQTPGAKKVTVSTLNKQAIEALEAVGLKTRQLKDGRTEVTTKNKGALLSIDAVKRALEALDGKTASTYTKHYVQTYRQDYNLGGLKLSGFSAGRLAKGGLVGYADGGPIQGFPTGGPVSGPGTSTSDSILAALSDGEFVINAAMVDKYGLRMLEAINEGRFPEIPGFARGGRVTKAEAEARKALIGQLTVSRFGQMAGWQRNELWSALARPQDVGALVDTLNQWRTNIKKATHGGVERSLLRQLDKAGKSLLKYAKQHDKVSKELDKAKSKLADLRNSFNQLRDSVASNLREAADVSKLTSGGRHATVGSIISELSVTAAQTKAFANALEALRKRGLDKTIIADIASAGIEGGGLRAAQTLLGASTADIKAINALQAQIAADAKRAGTTAAEAMYGAGIKAAEGLVKGLEKQKKSLEKTMDSLGKRLADSIKRALGIKGKAHGGVIGAAGGGARSGLTLVGEQGPELVRMPYGSTVIPNGRARQILAQHAAAGGGGRPIQVNLVLDGRIVARQLIDPLRYEINTLGGDVQAALGRRR